MQNLIKKISIVAGLSLVLAGCTNKLQYNPHALNYIEKTLAQEEVVSHPGERAAVDKAIRDVKNGVVKPKEVSFLFDKYIDNIKHPLEAAAYGKALKDLSR